MLCPFLLWLKCENQSWFNLCHLKHYHFPIPKCSWDNKEVPRVLDAYSSDPLKDVLNYHCLWLWLLSSQSLAGPISEAPSLDTKLCQKNWNPSQRRSLQSDRQAPWAQVFIFSSWDRSLLPLGVYNLLRKISETSFIHFCPLQLNFLSITLGKSTQQTLSKCEVGQPCFVKLNSKDKSTTPTWCTCLGTFSKARFKLPFPSSPIPSGNRRMKGSYPMLSHLITLRAVNQHTEQTQGIK